ncbi:MAG: GspMb/PilO family protein [Candidatus Omnitrophota bacterium]
MKIKTRALTRREKAVLGVTIGIALFALLSNFMIAPAGQMIKKIGEEITRKELLLFRYMRLLNKKEDILSLYNSHKDILEGDLGAEEISSVLFRDVRDASGELGLALKQVKPLPVKTDKKLNRVSLEAELEGNLASIIGFIDRLERLNPFIRISGLRISPQSGDSSSLRCRIMLSRIFF